MVMHRHLVLFVFLAISACALCKDVNGGEVIPIGTFRDIDGTTFEIPIKNSEDSKLKVLQAIPDCSCIFTQFEAFDILPGKSGSIIGKIKANYTESDMAIKKNLIVVTDKRELSYILSGTSLKTISLDKETINFGEFDATSIPHDPQFLNVGAPDKSYISYISFISESSDVEIKIVSANSCNTRVSFCLSDEFCKHPRPIQTTVYVRDRSWAPAIMIPISVTANVRRRAILHPESVNLGLVDDKQVFDSIVTITNPIMKEGFKIIGAERCEFDSQVKEISSGKFEARITGSIKGLEGHAFTKFVQLRTNDPDEPLISIRIFGAIPKSTCCHE